MKTYISLGAGVQSSTMALMAKHGELAPMPDAAVFADTQAEPKSVYRWLDWLEKNLPFPVYRVTHGNLATDSVRVTRSAKSGKLYSKGGIPVFMRRPDGGAGLMWRRCTGDYKIDVVHKEYKRLLGIYRVLSTSPVLATQWIGISFDELERRKPSRFSWLQNQWPLVDAGITRQDCLDWMQDKGYPLPPRSACVFCPYHSDAEWMRLKIEEPEEFKRAVDYELAYQAAVAADEVTNGTPFLHRSFVPLSEVVFNPDKGKRDFVRECEGMCGV